MHSHTSVRVDAPPCLEFILSIQIQSYEGSQSSGRPPLLNIVSYGSYIIMNDRIGHEELRSHTEVVNVDLVSRVLPRYFDTRDSMARKLMSGVVDE